MTPPPRTQTRGFLFADLRGYSRFTEQHGDDAARDLIIRYRALVRAELAAHDGAEIRTEGDSFYVVFESVADAVEAGLAIRNAAAEASAEPGVAPIRIGIGIHAGETRDGAEGIVSSAVNIAARVCSVAAGGEVLVTDTVRALIKGSVAMVFSPRGRRRLKGIAEPVQLYAAHESAPASMRSTKPLALGAIGIVGIGVAVIVGISARAPATPASPQPATSDRIAASATASLETQTFPDSSEVALIERLPDSIARTCDRADREAVPVYEDVAYPGNFGEFPLPLVAGLTCLVDLTRVVYWEATTPAGIDRIFAQEVGRRRVPAGECGQQTRAWQTWESSLDSGKLLCWSAADSMLWWTYDDDAVLVIASRRNGDIHELLSWWSEVGRLLQR